MTDNKLTDEQIIKALECCVHDRIGCNKYPLFDDGSPNCWEAIRRNGLALINRQKAEIERLKDENKKQKMVLENINDTIHPLPFVTDFDMAIKTAKSEAIKEFAERFNSLLAEFDDYDTLHIYEIKDRFDSVKEMVVIE